MPLPPPPVISKGCARVATHHRRAVPWPSFVHTAVQHARTTTRSMGKKNKRSADPDAPAPVLRDQGGLAAVARALAAQHQAAAAGGGVNAQTEVTEGSTAASEGDDGERNERKKKGKSTKREKKDKKEKREDKKKEKERTRRPPSPSASEPPKEKASSKASKASKKAKKAEKAERAEKAEEKKAMRRDSERGANEPASGRAHSRRGDEEGTETAAAARLAGGDDEDDAIIRAHREARDRKKINGAGELNSDAGTPHDGSGLLAAAASLDGRLSAAQALEFLTKHHVTSATEAEADEALFRECGRIAARAAHTIKRALRKSNVLMGSKADAGLDAAASLADDIRMRPGPTKGACRLWDSVTKHNAMVWGRTRAAVDDVANADDDPGVMAGAGSDHDRDHDRRLGGATCRAHGEGAADMNFDEYYRAAMVDAYGEDLDQMRQGAASRAGGERADVGIIMRAIQAGVDVMPTLQKELVLQCAALDELRELDEAGARPRGDAAESSDEDARSADDENEEGSDEDADEEEGSDDGDEDESEESEQDDEVDYEVTPPPTTKKRKAQS